MATDIAPISADGAMTVSRQNFCSRTGPQLPPCSYGDPKKLQANKLVTYQNNTIQNRHTYRLRFMRIWRMADLYKQAVQWLRRSFNLDQSQTAWWARLEFEEDDEDSIPTPVFDEFSPPIENDAARLGKPEYQGYARTATDADLKTRTAAELSQEVLQSELDRMGFAEEREKGELHMPLYGGWLMVSFWEQTYTDTTRIPLLTATKCPVCDFKTAKPMIAPSELPDSMMMPPGPPNEKGQLAVDTCPQCTSHMESQQAFGADPVTGELGMQTQDMTVPGGPKLQPFIPVGEEMDGKDSYGRELGRDVPIGRWKALTVSPYDFHPENLGIDVDGSNIQQFTWERVMKLDDIDNRWANGYLVMPEDPQTISEFHPIGGERNIFFSGANIPGGGDVFRNSARVRTTVIQPYREMVRDKDKNNEPVTDADGRPIFKVNRGRLFIIANRVVLEDGPLMVESTNNPGLLVPRMLAVYIPNSLRSGGREMWGFSLSEQLFDMVDYGNLTQSQLQDCQTTMGVPRWLVERTNDFDYDPENRAGGIYVWSYGGPDIPQPREVQSQLMDAAVFTALEYRDAAIGRITNTQKVEEGSVPNGVAAALAIQMLTEQTGERRRPKLARIKRALERVFTHGMDLNHEFVRETRELWIPQDESTWKRRCWQGIDITGVTTIKLKAEPEHDTEIQKQQTIRDMLQAGLFDVQDPRTRRVLARELGASSELIAQDDLQEEQAEREYIDLRDQSRVPVVDEDLDDHPMHAERHGVDCMSDYWRDLEDQAGWDRVLRVISRWKDPAEVNAPTMDPATNQPMMGPDGRPLMSVQQVDSPFKAFMRQAAIQPGGQPKLLEMAILGCWLQLMKNVGYQPKSQQEAKALTTVLQFRAHRAAHIMLAEQAKQAAMAGQAQLAAPAGAATAGGTVTAPGQPAVSGTPAAAAALPPPS